MLVEIMELQERRQNYLGMADLAARVPDALVSRVPATLATAAAQSGNVSDLLPLACEDHTCALYSTSVVKIVDNLGHAVAQKGGS